jgi:tRNA-specific 2-thiouridylase
MLDEYKKGRTPNPDVMCNKEVKFGHFLQKALAMGADYIATGHYAQNTPPASQGSPQGENPSYRLLEGKDANKDQSYFLWTLTNEQLEHVLFPVGHLQKSEVRALAKKFKLPTADKKDSQGICFIGKVDMKEFLSHYIALKPGNVLNEKGEIIGSHDGSVFYTIGQRHGFTILEKTPDDKPYYIIAKDIEKNTLTVSHKVHDDAPLQNVRAVTLTDMNIITPSLSSKLEARIRYRQARQKVTVEGTTVTFELPQDGVSLGQSIVLYDGEQCVGGGVIATVK